MHSLAHAMQQSQPSMTKHPRKTKLHRHTRKNPSRCLPPKHRINRCIHQEQDLGFPPAGYFPAPESHQSNLEQFKQTTEVRKRTATGISDHLASALTVSRTISLSFQSSFHLSLTVLVRYRSPANIIALEGYYLPLCAAVPSNTTLSTGPITRVSHLQ